MLLVDLQKRGVIRPPTWLCSNTHYLATMGSKAYGVSVSDSDNDIYGVVVPPKDNIFINQVINGYDSVPKPFNSWDPNNLVDKATGKTYDFKIYGAAMYFLNLRKNNINVIDSLFVGEENIRHISKAFTIIRSNRREFLHKGVIGRTLAYAQNQLHTMENQSHHIQEIYDFEKSLGIDHKTKYENREAALNDSIAYMLLNWNRFSTVSPFAGQSYEDVHKFWKDGGILAIYNKLWEDGMNKSGRFLIKKRYGFDVKFSYHIYRLISQAEYILEHGDLDLQEPERVSKMKAIRKGEISKEDIVALFKEAETRLNRLKISSNLRKEADADLIRGLLLNFLEEHYGSLEKTYNAVGERAVSEIRGILEKYGL